jgi:hypothetical protein
MVLLKDFSDKGFSFFTNYSSKKGTLILVGLGVYDYVKNVDTNDCSMTYMKQNPGLIPVQLKKLSATTIYNLQALSVLRRLS